MEYSGVSWNPQGSIMVKCIVNCSGNLYWVYQPTNSAGVSQITGRINGQSMTVWHIGDSIPYRGSSCEDNERERTPETLLNYWASLTKTNLSFYLDVGTRSLLRRPKRRARTGVRREPNVPSTTTAMKAPECGGLWWMDKTVTTCRLPLRCRGVEHNPR